MLAVGRDQDRWLALHNTTLVARPAGRPPPKPQPQRGTPPRGARGARLPMVGWFEPRQLLNTALQALISATFGRHSDRRLIEALARRDHDYYDYTCHYRELRDGTPVPEPRPSARVAVAGFRGRRGRRLELDVRDRAGARPAAPHGQRRYARVRHRARGPAGDGRRRGVSDAVAPRVRAPADRALRRRLRRRAARRAAARLRDPGQPRLVRQPGGVVAALLLERRRTPLRRLAHAPGAQLLRAQAAARMVAVRRRRPAPVRHRRLADRVLPGRRAAPHAAGRPRDPVPVEPELGVCAHVRAIRRLRRERPRLSA